MFRVEDLKWSSRPVLHQISLFGKNLFQTRLEQVETWCFTVLQISFTQGIWGSVDDP